ncbi:MAG TPA: STAS domain-containing protein [Acidimicrobiales bacterium]|jgi:rsbT antagonist protein RsbS
MAHVPILRQRGYLIATLQSAITDHEAEELQDELMENVTRFRARGVVVDVTVLDVLDSFAARTLRTIAYTTKLRGAYTVLVGVQPEVAFSMVRLGITMEHIYTALDLEEGLTFLDQLIRRRPTTG